MADLIWTQVLPARVYKGEFDAGGLRWRWWAMRESREIPRELWSWCGARYEVLHRIMGWTLVCEGSLWPDFYKPQPGEMIDFDGDGVNEHLVREIVSETELRTFIVNPASAERPVTMVTTFNTLRDAPKPRDVDGDGVAELVVEDSTFEWWMLDGEPQPSVKVEVVLELKNGAWIPKVSVMRGAPAPVEVFGAMETLGSERKSVEGVEPFWGRTIRMIYAGNERQAWEYFDRAWPGDKRDKAVFKQEILDRLGTSPWWPKIRAAYSRGE